jgi:hypothetical protein
MLAVEATDSSWRGLYRIAAPATLAMTVFFLFDTACWIVVGPYPPTAEGWYALLAEDRVVGTLLLSFPTFFGIILYYLPFLALFKVLKQVNAAYATLALLFGAVGLAVLLATNMAYPIAVLGEQFAAATTAAQRTLLLAAGETQMATAITGANIGGFLVEGALVVFSLLMLRSTLFGRVTAYIGIVGHGLDLTRITMNLAFVPEEIGAVLLMIGGLPQLVWLVLVARKFMQLGWPPDAVTGSTGG